MFKTISILFICLTTATMAAEPKVEFALDCVSEKSDLSKVVFVSLGKKAMFTNFGYGSQRALTLIETASTFYKYSVDTEFTGYGAKKIEGKTITVYRENLSILYSYGSGADPFRCSKSPDPIKAHAESKKFLMSEANRVADEADKTRANAEKEKQEQLKRNKI